MNTQRILSAGIAVVVVVAVGLSASTLAASMSTDPADAVDVDYDTLPLGDDAEGDIMAAAQGIHDQYSGGAASSTNPSDGASQDAEPSSDGATSDEAAQRDGGQGQSGASSSSDGLALYSWPRWLLLVAAALLALVAIAYRYRDRLRRAVERDGEPTGERLEPAPENEVERAWVELVRRAGVSQPRTRTPRDCAERAVETGYDPTVVNRLRRAFEDVRYGSTPPTDEQTRVATEALARLDGERS